MADASVGVVNLSWEHVRDKGVAIFMPYVEMLSDETLVIASSMWPWTSVTDEERASLRAEWVRRHPDKAPLGDAWKDTRQWAETQEWVNKWKEERRQWAERELAAKGRLKRWWRW